jgi:hypothetical protein
MLASLESWQADVREGPFLDVGCGWGRITFSLLAAGFAGRYIGIDVLQKRIDWLAKNITPVRPSFTFHFTDVRNDRYHPEGQSARPQLAAYVTDPVATSIMLSVFTHMWEDDMRAVMAPTGTFIFTAFLLTDAARRGIESGRSQFPMAFSRNANCQYFSEDNPLHAVAYTPAFLDKMIRDAGFAPTYHYGTWSGGPATISGQDWVVARPV